MRGHFPDHPQDSLASRSAPSLRALRGRWCRVGRVLRQGPAPRDPLGRICSLFPSSDEAQTTFSCVDVSTKGRKRRWTFILLGVGEASINSCHSLGGETEARSQPSTSQCCSLGEEHSSPNPTIHRVQTCSKLGTISRLGTKHSLPLRCQAVAVGLLCLQPLPPGRLFINPAPSCLRDGVFCSRDGAWEALTGVPSLPCVCC